MSCKVAERGPKDNIGGFPRGTKKRPGVKSHIIDPTRMILYLVEDTTEQVLEDLER